ncbi:MAG: amidohydrolase, partial [Actinomycetota bacterium]|nr:amidohydrolase [Actinomycetota bacterium]
MKVDALYSGAFTTFDVTRPTATALAVSSGRIVAIDADAAGLDALVRHDFGPRAAIFPGFHDAHCHTT